jgi:hypothetical protein
MTRVAPVLAVGTDDVWQIVADVWQSLLGQQAAQVEHAFGLDGTLTGSVDVRGDWTGLVTVTLPRRAADAVTRSMLGFDAADEVMDEDVRDAVGELANVIGGNVKALVPRPARLGLPRIVSGLAPTHAQLVCRVGVEWSGQVARVAVWHGGPHPQQVDEGGAR